MTCSLELLMYVKKHVEYIEVSAAARYWEDATVNGVQDTDGTLIPLRKKDCWCPIIRLSDGLVDGWPAGVEADIHYKVCDEGQYWLLDDQKNRVAQSAKFYVPDLLSISAIKDGDYIIMKIGGDGKVVNWKQPVLETDDWEPSE